MLGLKRTCTVNHSLFAFSGVRNISVVAVLRYFLFFHAEMLLKHACTFLCLYCTCGCFPFTIIRGCLCPSCESHVSVPMQARLLFMRGGLSLVGGGYYFNVRWSARPLRMCEAHQRLPARLPNDQVLSMSCATSKPLVPFPFFPFLLSLQSVTISLPLFSSSCFPSGLSLI